MMIVSVANAATVRFAIDRVSLKLRHTNQPRPVMKNLSKTILAVVALLLLVSAISCDGDDLLGCTGCPDDAPYGAKGGDCYATLSDCENNESGSCSICQ